MLIKKDKLDRKLNSVHVLTDCLGQLNIGKDIGGIDGDIVIIIVVLTFLTDSFIIVRAKLLCINIHQFGLTYSIISLVCTTLE